MAEIDELVEKAIEAAAIELHGWKNPDGPEWDGASERHKSRCRGAVKAQTHAALLAVGLPALLERVEAAEGEVARLVAANDRIISGVRAWGSINEIAAPPLDWLGLGEFLSRMEGTHEYAR